MVAVVGIDGCMAELDMSGEKSHYYYTIPYNHPLKVYCTVQCTVHVQVKVPVYCILKW